MPRIVFVAAVCLVAPAMPAWGALTLHDDLKLERVPDGDGSGTVTYPNGGGPFLLTIFEDNRTVWQSGDPTTKATHQGIVSGSYPNGRYWVGTDSTIVDQFYTFCAQEAISISLNTRYDIAGLQLRTLVDAKVLTGYAAWVFDKFNEGVDNSTIDPTLNTTANRNKLGVYQAAIWMGIVGWTDSDSDGVFDFSESLDAVGGATAELTGNPETYSLGSGTSLRSLATEGIRYSDFLDDTDWTPGTGLFEDSEYAMLRTWHNIEIINVQSDTGSDKQDLVIGYGGPTSIVPEPASLVVWSVLAGGAAGLTAARKRRLSVQRGRWSPQARDAIRAITGAA